MKVDDIILQEAPSNGQKKNKLKKRPDILPDIDDDVRYIKFDTVYGPLIQKNCKKILKIYKQFNGFKLLYRGISSIQDSFIGKSIDNRRPVDTRNRIHKQLVQLMIDTGFKAHRGNSIFTTTFLNQAGRYGAPYIIFPIDGFNYSWSVKHGDLFGSVLDGIHDITAVGTNDILFPYLQQADKYDYNFVNMIERMENLVSRYEDESPVTGTSDFKIYERLYTNVSSALNELANRINFDFNLNIDEDGISLSTKQLLMGYNSQIKKLKYSINKLTIILNTTRASTHKLIISLKKFTVETIKKLTIFLKNVIQSDTAIKQVFAKSQFSDLASKKKLIQKMGLVSNTALGTALQTRHEILISGRYYAFNEEEWHVKIRKWIRSL